MNDKDKYYILKGKETRKVYLIDGSFRKVRINNIVGYCKYHLHKGYVNIELLQKHKCIEKKCCFLDKFDIYPFWVSYNRKEQLKQMKKEENLKIKKQKEEIKKKRQKLNDVLIQRAKYWAEVLNFNIVITNAFQKSNSDNNCEYIINYVSENAYDDWKEYFNLALHMKRKKSERYILKHIKFSNGKYATIADWEKYNNK